jgi:hypothetical protein
MKALGPTNGHDISRRRLEIFAVTREHGSKTKLGRELDRRIPWAASLNLGRLFLVSNLGAGVELDFHDVCIWLVFVLLGLNFLGKLNFFDLNDFKLGKFCRNFLFAAHSDDVS